MECLDYILFSLSQEEEVKVGKDRFDLRSGGALQLMAQIKFGWCNHFLHTKLYFLSQKNLVTSLI